MSLSKKEKQKKPFYKRFWFIILMVFIVLGAIGNLNKSGTKIPEKQVCKKTFRMTDEFGREFALYFKEHAEVLDSGNKIDFVPGGDANFVSARVGEAWKDESISRKIYLSNELLKEKNRLFKEWLASKDGSLNSDDYNLELVVKVSDDAHTTIAQEYKNKMKIVNK